MTDPGVDIRINSVLVEMSGEDNWGMFYNACDASTHQRQSPINIVQKDAQYDPSLTTITLDTSGPPNDNITITNNGHTGRL